MPYPSLKIKNKQNTQKINNKQIKNKQIKKLEKHLQNCKQIMQTKTITLIFIFNPAYVIFP
jgi:hypothetical protein